MVILMGKDATEKDVERVLERLKTLGCDARVDRGPSTVIVVRGETARLDEGDLHLPGVRRIRRLTAPCPKALSEHHPNPTAVTVGAVTVGDGSLTLMAGPCAVESPSQLLAVARQVKAAGATMLRGGAYKPRRSPYAFQGLGRDALDILVEARRETGLPIVTEITSERQLDDFERHDIDLYQVGSRNMFNYELLKRLGGIKKPVLLKRSFTATVEEFLLAAEYLLSAGNTRVILCERGIRTFETAYRFVLDLNAVALLQERTHLPVIVDPSHGTGDRTLVTRLSLAAVAAGADGLLVEVHADPDNARSDAAQQLTPGAFRALAHRAKGLHGFLTSGSLSMA